MEKKERFYWKPFANSIMQQMVTVWSLVPLLSKRSLNIQEFSVRVMMKWTLKDFEQNFTSMGDVCHCAVIWTFFSSALVSELETGIKIGLV